jgi:hypothetical protein
MTPCLGAHHFASPRFEGIGLVSFENRPHGRRWLRELSTVGGLFQVLIHDIGAYCLADAVQSSLEGLSKT